MNEVTQILKAIERGDPQATEDLLPSVHRELQQLAAQRIGHAPPKQSLQITALVHEAYGRLVDRSLKEYRRSKGKLTAGHRENSRNPHEPVLFEVRDGFLGSFFEPVRRNR